MTKNDKESYSKVEKGFVSLFWEKKKMFISGECRFSAMKTKKRDGTMIIKITLTKDL